jgi:hypothetical protein
VGVGVTADVGQEGGVVHGRPVLVVEPDRLGHSQAGEALTQHLLHRLSEAQVDAQRERGDQLGQSQPRNRRVVTIDRRLTTARLHTPGKAATMRDSPDHGLDRGDEQAGGQPPTKQDRDTP